MNVVFCFPYAGGSASAYGDLKRLGRTRDIEVVPIEYAGRASRISDPLYSDIYETAEDCYRQIKEYLSKHRVSEYGFFGHSMGSWVVYEVAKLVQYREELNKPKVIFFSANTIPQIEIDKKMSGLANDVFWEEMYLQGGLEKELYEVKEFKDYILPIIKNDYRILEEYAGPDVEKYKIDSDVCVLAGREDNISESECRDWSQFTDHEFDIRWFNGDHFYIRNEGSKLVDLFCRKMNREA
ncbi:Surfactin synthase thioesterase subunit [Eubacterium ruminantium]|uniref:Surfactin synthase thioesterase subunit n=1 Tax=Eubacterium ruminantium TaxID=42322 RepID=A0A1T4QBP9_9FIRM|nr:MULTISPECIES: thioesterase domain-containing protein [Eubacterium]MCR5367792.1 thioesterase II family protein [Eubacterium sp.]SCW67076.1 Surfactin synthase thioesterase subunit [Eubacterium ruminantium]SDN36027.1 Surfactin synthase thioesterase subunit [Eubacterium ruminantium]SKA01213.1 Surfactin synthase thioesterase subunit [Eubacterium ruminantium]